MSESPDYGQQGIYLGDGMKEKDTSTLAAALWKDVQLPPVHAIGWARTARAINEFPYPVKYLSLSP